MDDAGHDDAVYGDDEKEDEVVDEEGVDDGRNVSLSCMLSAVSSSDSLVSSSVLVS